MIGRTEVEVAADTLYALRMGGVVAKSNMERAVEILGLRREDLLGAVDRAQTSHTGTVAKPGRISLIPESAPGSPAEPVEPTRKPDAPKRGKRQGYLAPDDETIPDGRRRRERRKVKGVTQLHCTGCSQWLPSIDFLMRSDRPGVRVSRCRECRTRYHRERRVTTRMLESLNGIGVRLAVDEGSNLIGLECACCGEPFKPGQLAVGEITELRHDTCAPAG